MATGRWPAKAIRSRAVERAIWWAFAGSRFEPCVHVHFPTEEPTTRFKDDNTTQHILPGSVFPAGQCLSIGTAM